MYVLVLPPHFYTSFYLLRSWTKDLEISEIKLNQNSFSSSRVRWSCFFLENRSTAQSFFFLKNILGSKVTKTRCSEINVADDTVNFKTCYTVNANAFINLQEVFS